MKITVLLKREYELNCELEELGIDEITDVEHLWEIEDNSSVVTTWLVPGTVSIQDTKEDITHE